MARAPHLRPILPWMLALLVFGYLLWRVPFAHAWDAAENARLLPFVAFTAIATLVWFWIDARVFARLFGRFNTPISMAQARSLRGLTYLLTPVHWNLGRAGVIARLRQSRRVPVLEGTSSMLLLQTIDAILLSTLAWIGLSNLPASGEVALLRTITSVFAVTLFAYLALAISQRPRAAWLLRIRGVSLHHAHRQARVRDLLVLAGWRGAYYAVFVAAYHFGLASFGIDLPLTVAVATVPIIQAIGALPITPAGLGTQQAAMLYFYSPYGAGSASSHGGEPAILAFGLAFPLLVLVLRCLIGSVYLAGLGGAIPNSVPPAAPTAGLESVSARRSATIRA